MMRRMVVDDGGGGRDDGEDPLSCVLTGGELSEIHLLVVKVVVDVVVDAVIGLVVCHLPHLLVTDPVVVVVVVDDDPVAHVLVAVVPIDVAIAD